MEVRVEANFRGKHGSHDYGLEEVGLTPGRVRERFGCYVERFRLPAA